MCARPSGQIPALSGGDRAWKKPDGRSIGARRYRALIAAFEEEIGGGELSEADRALLEQAAMLQLRVEQLRNDIINGVDVDDELIVKLAGASRRSLAAISAKAIERKPGAGSAFDAFMAKHAATVARDDDADDED